MNLEDHQYLVRGATMAPLWVPIDRQEPGSVLAVGAASI